MTETTAPPPEDLPDEDPADEDDAEAQPDALTGAPPDAEEIQESDPSHLSPEYELRSGVPDAPSDQDPGSMLGR